MQHSHALNTGSAERPTPFMIFQKDNYAAIAFEHGFRR